MYKSNSQLKGYKLTKSGKRIKLSWFYDRCKCGRIKQKISPHCRQCCLYTYYCLRNLKRNLNLIKDLKERKLMETEIARKYGISKQRVSQYYTYNFSGKYKRIKKI